MIMEKNNQLAHRKTLFLDNVLNIILLIQFDLKRRQ